MTAKKGNETRPPEKPKAAGAGRDAHPARQQLPDKAPPGDAGPFRAGEGRVDVTGIMPEGVHVDPDITEGHPGYQQSGESEIIPNDRLAKGGATPDKGP